MTDAIEKLVWSEFYDQHSRRNRLMGLMTNLSSAVARGDSLDIPYQTAPTNASSTARADAESKTPSVESLNIDQEVFFNVKIPRLTGPQYLAGNWVSQTAENMAAHRLNTMDDNLCTYLAKTLAYDASAANHINVAGDSLSNGDLTGSVAKVLSNDGRMREDLAWLIHPQAAADIADISGFIPNYSASEQGNLGIPALGRMLGIPVYESTACPRQRTVAATASAISSNELTLTVAAGHGIVPGMKITTAGATADVDTAAAVTSVTATTVVVPLTASNDASNGAATITIDACENFLVDRRSVFVATQQMPDIEVVKDYESAASALQLYSAYGRVGFAEGLAVFLSPATV